MGREPGRTGARAPVVCAGNSQVASELFLRGVLGILWGSDTFSLVIEAGRYRYHDL